MSANIAKVEPEFFQSGDTLRFDKSLPDFSGPTWALTYSLVSPSLQPISFVTNSTGSIFSVTVLPAITSAWVAGLYQITGTVSDGTNRYTIYQSEITITPDTSIQTGTIDYRTFAEKMLAAVELTLTGAISRRDISYSINGRTITAKTDDELFKARDYFKACVTQEKSFGKNRKVLTKFTSI